MNRANSKKTKLSKRGTKPHTYRLVVTGNVNGKAVVERDEPLLAYEFKTGSRIRAHAHLGQPGDTGSQQGAKV
jgi:hypothetical protein